MHNHNRDGFFQENGFGPFRRQDAPGRCDRQGGGREFGHRPGGPKFGEEGGRGFRGGPRGPRVKPGNMRLAVLALLAEEPRNGYGMIQEISQRSGGLWQPSPGAMYPALAGLEDEGLIEVQPQEGKKAYALTEEGRKYVQENAEALKEPWATEQEGGRGNHIDLRSALHGLMGAVKQVAQAGSAAQITEAASILNTARKGLYKLLAEDAE
ncbi:PadR family transcriptional regulator [Deinococcus sp. UYEF24]